MKITWQTGLILAGIVAAGVFVALFASVKMAENKMKKMYGQAATSYPTNTTGSEGDVTTDPATGQRVFVRRA